MQRIPKLDKYTQPLYSQIVKKKNKEKTVKTIRCGEGGALYKEKWLMRVTKDG